MLTFNLLTFVIIIIIFLKLIIVLMVLILIKLLIFLFLLISRIGMLFKGTSGQHVYHHDGSRALLMLQLCYSGLWLGGCFDSVLFKSRETRRLFHIKNSLCYLRTLFANKKKIKRGLRGGKRDFVTQTTPEDAHWSISSMARLSRMFKTQLSHALGHNWTKTTPAKTSRL